MRVEVSSRSEACFEATSARAKPLAAIASAGGHLQESNERQQLLGAPASNPGGCLPDALRQAHCVTEDKADGCPVRNLLDFVGGSLKRLAQAESLLWQGKVDETIALISPLNKKQAANFCRYLETHRHRIINYNYYQQEGICSIGSGAVESTIKQIDRRLKISGAQWHEANVPQVLKHRACLPQQQPLTAL